MMSMAKRNTITVPVANSLGGGYMNRGGNSSLSNDWGNVMLLEIGVRVANVMDRGGNNSLGDNGGGDGMAISVSIGGADRGVAISMTEAVTSESGLGCGNSQGEKGGNLEKEELVSFLST